MTKYEADRFQLEQEVVKPKSRRSFCEDCFRLNTEAGLRFVLSQLGIKDCEKYVEDWKMVKESDMFVKSRGLDRPPTTNYLLARQHFSKARHWMEAQALSEEGNA